ncbi:MAG: DUF3048 domain-containing protein [Lachnospiraceae bacterium]|nr:DUF3048 domain-containing protein [Lachnospiraceae bacterium]
MKKKLLKWAAAAISVAMLAGCGSSDETPAQDLTPAVIESQPIATEEPAPAAEPAAEPVAEEPVAEEEPEFVEGCYRSELTNEWIDESLKDQRPIAVMVDNEITALPHFGVSQADIVYEMVNSLANDRVTRFMMLVKDWENLEQFGSTRSTRPTNIIIAPEYNAILCHDGGPYHNDAWFARSWAPDHLSGIFKRFSNGKATEFTEYITGDKLTESIGGKISRTYDDVWGQKFQFANKPFTFGTPGQNGVLSATRVDLSAAFKHNRSTLTYDAEKGVYVYNEYAGSSNKFGFDGTYYDALNNESMTFTNVILQCCSLSKLDDNGYMIYNALTSNPYPGYYLTGGQAIPITWTRPGEVALTKYYNAGTGQEITLNTGKTYIAIVPDTYWQDIIVE